MASQRSSEAQLVATGLPPSSLNLSIGDSMRALTASIAVNFCCSPPGDKPTGSPWGAAKANAGYAFAIVRQQHIDRLLDACLRPRQPTDDEHKIADLFVAALDQGADGVVVGPHRQIAQNTGQHQRVMRQVATKQALRALVVE